MVDNDGVGGCCGVMDARQQSGTAGGNQTTSSAQRSEYLRNKALAAAIDDGESVAGAARRYGVSRQWAYEIKRWWDADCVLMLLYIVKCLGVLFWFGGLVTFCWTRH